MKAHTLRHAAAAALALACVGLASMPVVAGLSGVTCAACDIQGHTVYVAVRNGSRSPVSGVVLVQALVGTGKMKPMFVATNSGRFSLAPGGSTTVPVSFQAKPSAVISSAVSLTGSSTLALSGSF